MNKIEEYPTNYPEISADAPVIDPKVVEHFLKGGMGVVSTEKGFKNPYGLEINQFNMAGARMREDEKGNEYIDFTPIDKN